MSAWVGLLQGTHALIAMRRDEPHWLLTDADAKVYGQAVANAARHLPIGATQKALDFAALAICIGNIETPRVYASMRNNRAKRAKSSPQPATAQVFQFRQNPPPAAPPNAPVSPPDGSEGFIGDGIDAPPIGGHS